MMDSLVFEEVEKDGLVAPDVRKVGGGTMNCTCTTTEKSLSNV
jgi:hypothetical protein